MAAMHQIDSGMTGCEPCAIARVAASGETTGDLAADSQRLGSMGVKTLVFQTQALLDDWRARVAALAR